MQREQMISFRNYMFFFTVFFTIFNYIPQRIQLEILGSQYGTKLSLYPVLIWTLGTLWYTFSQHFEVGKPNYKILLFIGLYASTMIISIIHGLEIYPYYSTILSEPADHLKKMFFIKHFFAKFGIALKDITLLKMWISIRAIKQTFAEIIWGFGLSYLIYICYKNEAKTLVKIIFKSIICSSILVCSYGIIDFFYLAGYQWASKLLCILNPLFHDVPSNNQWWWPPLLWPNQLRSIFPEPSYLGIWAAFAIPWLWYGLYFANSRKTKFGCIILNIALPFCLFLSKARTANALLVGELILFAIVTLIYRKNIWKSFIKALLCIIVAFCLNLVSFQFLFSTVQNENRPSNNLESNNAATEYIDDNLASITAKDTRSNGTRYAIMQAGLNIGKDHPMFGVGKTFRNSYLLSYLSNQEKKYSEIQVYIKRQQDKGILNSGIPMLTEYANRFAETGIIGCLLYCLPIVTLLYKSFYLLKDRLNLDNKIPLIFFMISFCGVLASGFGDSLDVTYCYWILLGVGYTLCHSAPACSGTDVVRKL